MASTDEGRLAGWLPRVDDAVRVAIHRDQTCPGCSHFRGESGRTGRVVEVRAPIGAPSHPYLVVLDRATGGDVVRDLHMSILARHYAADELEPIA
jgi:hypothetical protein